MISLRYTGELQKVDEERLSEDLEHSMEMTILGRESEQKKKATFRPELLEERTRYMRESVWNSEKAW